MVSPGLMQEPQGEGVVGAGGHVDLGQVGGPASPPAEVAANICGDLVNPS